MQFHIPRELDKALQKEKSLIDRLALLAGVIGPLATIPQAIGVWSGSTDGVSLLMWMLFLFVSVVLLIYSLLYRLKSMLVAQLVWVLMEVIILTGLIIKN